MSAQQALGAPKYSGEILLCEDNELNQYVIKTQLSRLGFEVSIANNGKEGVDIIARSLIGGKQFKLILMDIYMPEMGGLEAADAIIGLGCKTPIVALTANTSQKDTELYTAHGMPDSLKKPIVQDELLNFLNKHFTSIGVQPENAVTRTERAIEDERQKKKLLTGFVKRNLTTYDDINTAIQANDIKLAHRLAHTLRGLAGLMGKTALREAARNIEFSLADGDISYISDQMDALRAELFPVLDELRPLLDEPKPKPVAAFDREKAAELMDRLGQLLSADNAASAKLAEELRGIPGTEALIEQVEDYEFETALKLLENLRKDLGV